MAKKLELDRGAHEELIQYCEIKEIKFLSTAFDDKSLFFLKSLKPRRYKIPSGENTDRHDPIHC